MWLRSGVRAQLLVVVVLLAALCRECCAEEDGDTWDVIVDYFDDAWFLVCFITGCVIIITCIVVSCCVCRMRRRRKRQLEGQQLQDQESTPALPSLASFESSQQEMISKETLGLQLTPHSPILRNRAGAQRKSVTLHKNRKSVTGLTLKPCGDEDEPGVLVDVVKIGSSAERSGLHPGDRIIAVNGRSFFGMTTQQAYNVLQQVHGALRVQIERPSTSTRHITHHRQSTDLTGYVPAPTAVALDPHDDDDHYDDGILGGDGDADTRRGAGSGARRGVDASHGHHSQAAQQDTGGMHGGDGGDGVPEGHRIDHAEPPAFEESHIRHSATGDRLVYVGDGPLPPPPQREAPKPKPKPKPRVEPRSRKAAGRAQGPAAQQSMDVNVLNKATHEHITFTASATTTVLDLKSYILRTFDIPIDCQVLHLGDVELTNDMRLGDASVCDGSVVALTTTEYTAM